jgi:hypothetical protein
MGRVMKIASKRLRFFRPTQQPTEINFQSLMQIACVSMRAVNTLKLSKKKRIRSPLNFSRISLYQFTSAQLSRARLLCTHFSVRVEFLTRAVNRVRGLQECVKLTSSANE